VLCWVIGVDVILAMSSPQRGLLNAALDLLITNAALLKASQTMKSSVSMSRSSIMPCRQGRMNICYNSWRLEEVSWKARLKVKKLHHSSNLAALEKIAEAKGFKCAPITHAIYGEGATITFAQHQTAGRPLKSPQKTPDPSNVKSARDVANG